MQIGILADTHNQMDNTRKALDTFAARNVTRLLHCGDITTVAVVELFEGTQTTFVFGNMDRFHSDLMNTAKQLMGMGSAGYSYTAELGGARIAMTHGNDEVQLLQFVQSGDYDYVFHGHTHRRRDEMVNNTRVINPGALGGRRAESRSICILDLETDDLEFIEIADD
ncbi:MAG: metallophosphoesterase [Chloroflexi bacterium]|nr:metallophosphoesterase [Chloroflexota bacterium]